MPDDLDPKSSDPKISTWFVNYSCPWKCSILVRFSAHFFQVISLYGMDRKTGKTHAAAY